MYFSTPTTGLPNSVRPQTVLLIFFPIMLANYGKDYLPLQKVTNRKGKSPDIGIIKFKCRRMHILNKI